MGLLKKLFGGGSSLEGLRKAVAQKRFADARLQAEDLLEEALPEAALDEVRQLHAAAGDGLARLNLEEALALRRVGNVESAAEHLQLALDQVFTEELRKEIEAAGTLEPEEVITAPATVSGSCASCGPQVLEPLDSDDVELLDRESRVELILASYPAEVAERYRQKGDQFFQAFLLSHSGQDELALGHWQQVPDEERDELFWFEYGAAQGRCGKNAEGCSSLEKSLTLNPGFLPASEALVQLLLAAGSNEQAETHLQQLQQAGRAPLFCQVQLTTVCLHRGDQGKALEYARQALTGGVADPRFLLLAASLLEQAGELQETEAVLKRLPAGGGCGTGMSWPLAEFMLRQQRELPRVLDTFNAACRQEPQNPRWQLRVAQTYLARNWIRQGLELLQKVVGDPRLEPELQQEAEQLLARHGG